MVITIEPIFYKLDRPIPAHLKQFIKVIHSLLPKFIELFLILSRGLLILSIF